MERHHNEMILDGIRRAPSAGRPILTHMTSATRVIVMVAMEEEAQFLYPLLGDGLVEQPPIRGIVKTLRGNVKGLTVDVVVSGIGAVFASSALTAALSASPAMAVISCGCSGAHIPEQHMGDIVIGAVSRQPCSASPLSAGPLSVGPLSVGLFMRQHSPAQPSLRALPRQPSAVSLSLRRARGLRSSRGALCAPLIGCGVTRPPGVHRRWSLCKRK